MGAASGTRTTSPGNGYGLARVLLAAVLLSRETCVIGRS